MGHTIRVTKDSISGVKAMSTAPTPAMRSLLRFPRSPPLPPAQPSRAASPLVLLPVALLTLKVEAQRPFLPAKREPDPPVEGPRCGLEGLPETSPSSTVRRPPWSAFNFLSFSWNSSTHGTSLAGSSDLRPRPPSASG
jgi:hypothetical protein